MPDFLLTATDSSGQRDTLRVNAGASQEAWRQLESQGYRDIALHTSDVEALTPMTALDSGHITPADYVRIRTFSRARMFLFLLARLYWQARKMLVVALILLAFNWWTLNDRTILTIIALALIALPLAIAIWGSLFGRALKYARFVDAAAWGRWQEVLKLAPAFLHGSTEFDAAARQASALAALGRLPEGVQVIDEHYRPGETPKWMYYARVAEVYNVAKLYDKALACHRLAYEDAPDDPTVQLDMAMALLKNETDLPLAKQLIESAESQHLSDLLLAFMPHAKGLHALNAGSYAEAKRWFTAAHEKLQPFLASSPLIGVAIDVNRANLAIALAKSGDLRGALDLYALARPRLIALDSSRLLDQVQRALGTR
jgi:tetratricopeptide (TPR) repeat protein